MPVTAPTKPTSAQIAEVTHEYHAVANKELPAVLAPDATADYVARVHAADIEARKALAKLEHQGKQLTVETLAVARAAVRRLVAILEERP
jgi:iron-sulfur cluster repair protein YtfE (RIC family)